MVQWIARLTSNQGDVGSSPAQGLKTNFFRTSVYINTGLTRTKTSHLGINLNQSAGVELRTSWLAVRDLTNCTNLAHIMLVSK